MWQVSNKQIISDKLLIKSHNSFNLVSKDSSLKDIFLFSRIPQSGDVNKPELWKVTNDKIHLFAGAYWLSVHHNQIIIHKLVTFKISRYLWKFSAVNYIKAGSSNTGSNWRKFSNKRIWNFHNKEAYNHGCFLWDLIYYQDSD